MHKVNLPLGTRDGFGKRESKKYHIKTEIEKKLLENNFMKVSTPLLEHKEVFADFDLKQMGTYQLLDSNDDSLILRPDLTLPLARFLATNNVKLPQRFYYVGERFKISKALSGKYNQMTQAGIEIVGYPSIRAELECMLLINQISTEFLQGKVQIELGHAQFANSILDELTQDELLKKQIKTELFRKNMPKYLAYISVFKDREEYEFLEKWPRLFGNISWVLRKIKEYVLPEKAQQIINELTQVTSWLEQLPNQKVLLDLSVAPPQNYYTGITFKGFMESISEYVFSGGRYDQLLENFQEQAEPAVGMGIDLEILADFSTISVQKERKDLLYYQPNQLGLVNKILNEHKFELSMEDDLKKAFIAARNQNTKLYMIDKGGNLRNVTEDCFD
ncbi:ATP phosphoribosyltransferase regulatory subunit [Liquorilactobacillus mali]|uniref:ATP phosphoribosyltransferase regulatory subunit n=1 Tax=Liquorilactobacillus mali KCTC 3596 = DSM 20444 TaxID=1046596 RepID=J0L184_9LACO|nr:ATP phosphoribosyltransferase regulatory subunit [Liquorilactobacillus mali]EJF01445.1 histidine-tRNA synthetase [Liquorilactobacillus mali KCTC 3596 = DSM 20444]KRN10096.1 histidine--tRNA ligase [Liquorilactobacillus mali KCTC 3596 = DSM 20444]MDC7953859.1 ATP phosphoribosyltransferase regulatory subunit [Liquorilactobacillus mali]QFQ75204.1 ATP phosphoribosyltransferase regulatory subunit [Liquorilactobacillus mali]